MTLPGTPAQAGFLRRLFEYGHLVPSGEPGVYGRGEQFTQVLDSIGSLLSRIAEPDQAELLRFPPVIAKRTLEKAGYLKSFPQLCGSVFSFAGGELAAGHLVEQAAKGEDWSQHLSMTSVAMTPAACYPAYPAVAQRGDLSPGGVTLDLGPSYVFRNEPSNDPARLQMFQQREMVRIGTAEEVLCWREVWMRRAAGIFDQLALDYRIDVASDPFFGRGGKLLARNQRDQNLKFEVLVPIASEERTAVASFNYHQQYFGSAFGIRLQGGEVASSACLGFGMERITLALFQQHGLLWRKWPTSLCQRLGLLAMHAGLESIAS